MIIKIVVKPRRLDKKTTSREMFWNDVDVISLYKKKIRRENVTPGRIPKERFEADRDVIHRIVEFYVANHPDPPNKVPVSTLGSIPNQ